MILKRLTMHNFGVYAGTNTFEFSRKKPIVLIGGMNGRGKTTFLEAILLSLYGSNSIAFRESNYTSYNKYLRSYVNKSHWSQSTYVELEFIMNENTYDTYVVRREWDALSKITKEKIIVRQNGLESDFLTKNWAMFVENILPNALSSFYFFDGEKIAELAVDNTNIQMKESIRAMLGITVLDVLKNDLGRSIKRLAKKSAKNESVNKLETLRDERDQSVEELEKKDAEIDQLNAKIADEEVKLADLHNQYKLKGGDVIEQKQNLMQKRSDVQAEISKNADSLITLSSTSLPLILVKDLLQNIKLQAEDEHNDSVMHEAIGQLDEYLDEFASATGINSEANRGFLQYIKNKTAENSTERIYGLSDHALFQINDLLERNMEQRVSETQVCIKRKNELQKSLDELDSYLSLDINESELATIYDQIKEQEKRLLQLRVDLSTLEQERITLNASVIMKTSEFNQFVEKYLAMVEMYDEETRMLQYSNMALQLTDAFTIALQKRKTGILGQTITDCYKKLANKKNMIQKIVMDSETLDMRYLDETGNEVSKESLSAGEKQLMVIAILWALALCSKKKLPIIIDTPLSRLDSQHRTSIITTYFPNASDQTIILSTDTEIDHNYYDIMKNAVGDEFTLVYDENTKSTTIKKGYFQNI